MSFRQKVDHFSWLLSCHLRVCAHCLSFGLSVDVLCPKCWDQLLGQRVPNSQMPFRDRPEIFIYRLLDWRYQDSQVVASLVYALKNGGLAPVFSKLALYLWTKRLASSQVVFPVYFIPCPSKVPSQRDHAWALANALKQVLSGGILVEALVLGASTDFLPQKGRRLAQRQTRSFALNPGMQNFLGQMNGTIVFVDDVVTSQSTALAAYHALGKPKNFETWCLVQRSLLDS